MKKVLVRSSVMIKKQILFCLILYLLTSNLYAVWANFTITPTNPTPSDVIDIYLEGMWGDSCIPIGSDASVIGNDIYIVLYLPPPSACATVMTPWYEFVQLAPLAAGTYDIYVGDEVTWIGNFEVGFSKAVTLLSPDGGETLRAGEVHSVTWSSAGAISDVKLEYSDDNGLAWDEITASTANDEQYDWTVPEVTSSQCLVRVSDASDAGVNDESDAVFTIYVCLLDSPADANGDCKVTILDLAIVAAEWLKNGNPFDPDYSP